MSLKIKSLFYLALFLILFIISPIVIFSQEKSTFLNKTSQPKDLQVDYVLAYPGLLPDSKLYKIKLIRDKIMRSLINDPIKKIEYDLLLSDKTINAAKLLLDKGDFTLAKETSFKGENYFTELVTHYKWAFWTGNKIPIKLEEKIKMASLKHQEVFADMMRKTTNENRSSMQQVIDFSKRNEQELVNIKVKKNK